MTDRLLVPLPDGRWLALTREAFDAALAEGSKAIAAPAAVASAQDSEPLLDARELAAALHVPVTQVEEGARRGRIPALKCGRYWRFKQSAVERALSAAGANGGA